MKKPEVTTVDARQLKAEAIVAGGKITRGNGYYLVPASSGAARHKVVMDALFPSCTCADFELTDRACKHLIAVKLWLEQEKAGSEPPAPKAEPSPRIPRKTYPQDWPNYNAAQINERGHFMELLADLCRTIPQPPPKRGQGRRPIPLADAIYSAVVKVYGTQSARRSMGDLEEAKRRKFIDKVPHFNSVLNCLDSEEATPILVNLIRLSSLPLAEVEADFAADSSGFCTTRYTRWFDVKYGAEREQADWVKVHLMCGVKTNVVTAAEILGPNTGDAKQLPKLVKATAAGFHIAEVSTDMAYTATDNFKAVEEVGGTLYSPFKKNATGGIGGIFEKAFHYFCMHREEFLAHYHKRSNVESTFSMLKRKFGESVRSKTDRAMMNEVYAKIVAHNLCCCIAAWYELGIEPLFGADAEPDAPKNILPMLRRG